MQSLSSLFSEVVCFVVRFYEDYLPYILLVFDFLVSLFWQGKKADQLIKYFGEDPVRCPFEQGMIPVLLIHLNECVLVIYFCNTSKGLFLMEFLLNYIWYLGMLKHTF